MDFDKEIKEICEILYKAADEYKDVTPNQEGMPSHLLGVAALLSNALEEVSKLERRCVKESNRWMRNLYGYPNNNSNSNNNNSTRKRKRTNSPKHNNK